MCRRTWIACSASHPSCASFGRRWHSVARTRNHSKPGIPHRKMRTTKPTPARILIVDDEAAQMKALCDTLRDHDFETVGFTSGQAALAALRKQRFDLVLSDLMMPEIGGIALLQ